MRTAMTQQQAQTFHFILSTSNVTMGSQSMSLTGAKGDLDQTTKAAQVNASVVAMGNTISLQFHHSRLAARAT